ncbi:MAG: hypothetical protein KDA60_14065 [Planctomycetales bacterium]|nr:hypothetical protein [Planctomycetales bacterium]
MNELGHLYEKIESTRLWLVAALAASVKIVDRMWDLFIEVITAVPRNRWLVREATQREQYIEEFEATTAKRIHDRDERIKELETQLDLLIASYSGTSQGSIPASRVRQQRRRVKQPSDNGTPT